MSLLLHLAPLDSRTTLPSWDPDWSRRRQTGARYMTGIASGGAKSAVINIDDRRPTLTGLYVGTVSTSVPSNVTLGMTDFTERAMCLSRLAVKTLQIAGLATLKTLATVLCAGEVNDCMVPSYARLGVASELVSTLSHIIERPDSVLESSERYFVQQMTLCAAGRCIFIMDGNKLGLGAPCSKGRCGSRAPRMRTPTRTAASA